MDLDLNEVYMFLSKINCSEVNSTHMPQET